jgi:YD repeat-containing protein
VSLYDATLRPIQTQAPTADGETGRLITDTHYNTLGQTVKTTSAYYDATTGPTSTVFVPANDSAVPEESETFYDGLGRTVQALTVAQGTNQWSATTAYKGVDETAVTPPAGGTATSKFTDALGRTAQSWAYTTATPTGTASNATITSYSYTPAGKPATMTDTVGDAWSWTYDLHGRQIKALEHRCARDHAVLHLRRPGA